jgi:hypothetical protein
MVIRRGVEGTLFNQTQPGGQSTLPVDGPDRLATAARSAKNESNDLDPARKTMRARGMSVPCFWAVVALVPAVPAGAANPPRPPASEVVQAWNKAGARFGWFREGGHGWSQFEKGRKRNLAMSRLGFSSTARRLKG